jgi:hypothetical protein
VKVISPLRLAQLCAAAYDPMASWAMSWERNDVHFHACVENGVTILVARGTEPYDLEDWIADFSIRPTVSRRHPLLGLCHAGFLTDVEQVAAEMQHDTQGQRVIVTGHSKGAAEALLFAAMQCCAGATPLLVVTFGSPRPGFVQLQELLRDLPGVDYRNGADPVPDLPLAFLHPRHLKPIGTPSGNPIRDHFIESYIAALAA